MHLVKIPLNTIHMIGRRIGKMMRKRSRDYNTTIIDFPCETPVGGALSYLERQFRKLWKLGEFSHAAEPTAEKVMPNAQYNSRLGS